MYFCFLSTYMKSLTFISAIGVLFHFFGSAYSPMYAILLLLWSTSFVEYWKVCERKISVRWGTHGAFRVETHRHEFNPDDLNDVWWKIELKRFLRITASIPVIIVFVAFLTVILTGLFVFEAFITQLYTGPGKQYIVRHGTFPLTFSQFLLVTRTYCFVHGGSPQFHVILPICQYSKPFIDLH